MTKLDQAKLFDGGRYIGVISVEPGVDELDPFDVAIILPPVPLASAPVFEWDGRTGRYCRRRDEPARAPSTV